MRIYFVRHGESTANLAHEFANRGWNHPLTGRGIEQAHIVASGLAGSSIGQVYSSPVMRAVQTAQVVADILQSPLETSEALREWDVGVYEGRSDPIGWVLHRQVQEDWFVHHKFDSRMPGGESFNDIRTRFIPFINDLLTSQPHTNVALVSHGGLYTAMLPLVLTNVDWSYACQHGFSYTSFALAESQPAGLCCLTWCGVDLTQSGSAD